ncbi:RNase P/MRP, p29 subunit [Xylariaceae sp. FL0255]|nr:RNase P/MRP, p29 subunit [Xylariaceae sp. FL0255]
MPPKDEPQSLTHQLLRRAHSPDTANRIFADKIQHRPLFLKPSSPPPPNTRDARRKVRKEKQKRAKALKPKPLSVTQRKKLGLTYLPRRDRLKNNKTRKENYAVYAPLNKLWLSYIREVLGSEIYGGGEGAAAKLSAADFHGADIEVARSRCPSRVGVRGIVLRDSRFAFTVVTKRDEVKLLPKEGTVFRVLVPPPSAGKESAEDSKAKQEGHTDQQMKDGEEEKGEEEKQRDPFIFEIHGDQFQFRSADRANKKFRTHFLEKL